MGDCVAAIDQGTQSTRVFIFDNSGTPIASHQEQFKQIYPKAGWCEHDPLIIWGSVQRCIESALAAAQQSEAAARAGPVKVVALGITNQRETTLVWSRSTGQPLHNAVVWLDNRTSEICHRWEASLPGGKDHFRPVTGLPISTYFSAYKFQWMFENVPQVRAAVENGDALFGTIDSWIIYCLTGGKEGGTHVTDVTNASRTNLMELSSRRWHGPFLQLFKLTPDMMPRIASNAEVYGSVAAGPLAGVPIAGCLGDQMAALLGQRAAPGEAKNTYGTGCFMLLNTGHDITPSRHGLLTTVAHQLGPHQAPCYALEGSVAVAGLGISWLRDNLRIIDSADESEAIANTVPDTGGVYFVPAFGGLLAPHWQEDARGTLLGMTAFTTRGHVVRAMLEAICFQTREVLEAMILDTTDHRAATTGQQQQEPHQQPAAAKAEAAGHCAGSSSNGCSGRAPLGAEVESPAEAAAAVANGGGSAAAPDAASAAAAAGPRLNLLRVDGGASHNNTLMQVQVGPCAGGGAGTAAPSAAAVAAAAGSAAAASCGMPSGAGRAASAAPIAAALPESEVMQLLQHLLVDGGSAGCDSLMQLQSDILQVPVLRPHFQETTALGAALAAGLTVGLWDEAFVTRHPPDHATTFQPSVSPEMVAKRFGHWKKAVSRCLDLADLAT